MQDRDIARLQTLVEQARCMEQTQSDSSAQRMRLSDDAFARVRGQFQQVAEHLPEAFTVSDRPGVPEGEDVAMLKWHATAPARALVMVRNAKDYEIRVAYYRPATDEESDWHVVDPAEDGGILAGIEGLADQLCWQSGGWPPLPGPLRKAQTE